MAYDATKWAEGLIRQLPDTHEGRNSWLLNHGHGDDVEAMRDRHPTYRKAHPVDPNPPTPWRMFEVVMSLPEGRGSISINVAAGSPEEARRMARDSLAAFQPMLSATLYRNAAKATVYVTAHHERGAAAALGG